MPMLFVRRCRSIALFTFLVALCALVPHVAYADDGLSMMGVVDPEANNMGEDSPGDVGLSTQSSASPLKDASGTWGTCKWKFDSAAWQLTISPKSGKKGTLPDTLTGKNAPPKLDSVAYSGLNIVFGRTVQAGKSVKDILGWNNASESDSCIKVDLSGLDFSKTTDFSYMLAHVHKYSYIDGSTTVDRIRLNFKNSHPTSFNHFMAGANFSYSYYHLDLSKATNFESMYEDSRFTQIWYAKSSYGKPNSKRNMKRMFANMKDLYEIDLGGLDNLDADCTDMFAGTEGIKEITIGKDWDPRGGAFPVSKTGKWWSASTREYLTNEQIYARYTDDKTHHAADTYYVKKAPTSAGSFTSVTLSGDSKSVDVLSKACTIDRIQEGSIGIDFAVSTKREDVAAYRIVQCDMKTPTTTNVSVVAATTGTHFDIQKKGFEKRRNVYIVAVDKDAKVLFSKQLLISVKESVAPTNFQLGKGITFSGFPKPFDGMSFEMAGVSLPVSLDYEEEGNKLSVGINWDVKANKTLKAQMKDMMNTYKRQAQGYKKKDGTWSGYTGRMRMNDLQKSLFKKPDDKDATKLLPKMDKANVYMMGYLEGDYRTYFEGCFCIGIKVADSYEFQVWNIPPVVVGFNWGLDGNGEGILHMSWDGNGKWNGFEGSAVNLNASGNVGISAGFGVANTVSVCAYLSGGIEGNIGILPEFGLNRLALVGSGGIRGKVFKHELFNLTLIDGTKVLYNKPEQLGKQSAGASGTVETQSFSMDDAIIEKDVITTQSVDDNAPTIVKGSYEFAHPQLVEFDDMAECVFDDGYGLSLAEFDGDMWSAPQELVRGNIMAFDVASSSNHMVVSYQVGEDAASSDIWVMAYDQYDGAWSEPMRLTDSSDVLEVNPVVGIDGSDVYVSWTENKEADEMGTEGALCVKRARIDCQDILYHMSGALEDQSEEASDVAPVEVDEQQDVDTTSDASLDQDAIHELDDVAGGLDEELMEEELVVESDDTNTGIAAEDDPIAVQDVSNDNDFTVDTIVTSPGIVIDCDAFEDNLVLIGKDVSNDSKKLYRIEGGSANVQTEPTDFVSAVYTSSRTLMGTDGVSLYEGTNVVTPWPSADLNLAEMDDKTYVVGAGFDSGKQSVIASVYDEDDEAWSGNAVPVEGEEGMAINDVSVCIVDDEPCIAYTKSAYTMTDGAVDVLGNNIEYVYGTRSNVCIDDIQENPDDNESPVVTVTNKGLRTSYYPDYEVEGTDSYYESDSLDVVLAPGETKTVDADYALPYNPDVVYVMSVDGDDEVTLDLSKPWFSLDATSKLEGEFESIVASVQFSNAGAYTGDMVFENAVDGTELARIPYSAVGSYWQHSSANVEWIPDYQEGQNKLDDLGVTMVSVHIEPDGWDGDAPEQVHALAATWTDSLLELEEPRTYELELDEIGDREYTGDTVTPSVTVLSDGYPVADGDYEITYSDNVNVGTANVSVKGLGDYAGKSCEKTFEIVKRDLKDADVYDADDAVYTGKEIEVKPVVEYNFTPLVEGKDYKLQYSKNVNAGTATVTAVGIGNNTGSKSATFKIGKATTDLTVTPTTREVLLGKVKKKSQIAAAPLVVSGAYGKVTYAKVSGSKALAVNANTGKITVKKGTKKGTYKVGIKVTAAGDANHVGGSKSVTCTVKVVKKLKNTMVARPVVRTAKYNSVKNKNVNVASLVSVKKAKGKVSYKKVSGNKKIVVASNGKVTVMKGIKKGAYQVKLKVAAAGNKTYKGASRTVTCQIVVK